METRTAQPADVFVTHDQEKALEAADRQLGTPDPVYPNSRTPFVFDFLGNVNPFHGRRRASGSGLEVRPGPLALPALKATVEHILDFSI